MEFTDLRHIGLAYTTTEDEKHELQVNADLVDYSISYLVDGVQVHEDKYESLTELIEQELSVLDFDSLISVGMDAIPEEPAAPDLTEQPVTREGDTLTIGNGPATHEIDITVSDEEWKQIKEAIPDNTAQNFHITDPDLGAGGPKTKYQNNVAAIRLLKVLEEQGRSATPEEQEVLSRYVGWGGV